MSSGPPAEIGVQIVAHGGRPVKWQNRTTKEKRAKIEAGAAVG